MSDSIVTKNILFCYDDSLIHARNIFFFTMRVRFGSKLFVWWSYGVRSWLLNNIFYLPILQALTFYIKGFEWSLLRLLIWCLNHNLGWSQFASFYLFVCVVSCYQYKYFSVCYLKASPQYPPKGCINTEINDFVNKKEILKSMIWCMHTRIFNVTILW